MGRALSLRRTLGLLLLLSLLVPTNWLPALVRNLLLLVYLAGIGYLLFWLVSGLIRAPQAYHSGKNEARVPRNEVGDQSR